MAPASRSLPWGLSPVTSSLHRTRIFGSRALRSDCRGVARTRERSVMSSTRVRRHVRAPRARVYGALVDADAVAKWKVPDGMTIQVHAFEGYEGGTFRI